MLAMYTPIYIYIENTSEKLSESVQNEITNPGKNSNKFNNKLFTFEHKRKSFMYKTMYYIERINITAE